MEFRCDRNGNWHFSSECPKWPTNSVSIAHREKLPHKFEVCGQCKTLKGQSMRGDSMIRVNHAAVLQRVNVILNRVGFKRHV